MILVIITALVAIGLAYAAGNQQAHTKAAKDIERAVDAAVDHVAQSTNRLYAALLAVNGYAIDGNTKIVKHSYKPYQIKSALQYLVEMGLVEK